MRTYDVRARGQIRKAIIQREIWTSTGSVGQAEAACQENRGKRNGSCPCAEPPSVAGRKQLPIWQGWPIQRAL